jgi:signal transduction histidine kinase
LAQTLSARPSVSVYENALKRSHDELAVLVTQRTAQLTALSQHLLRIAEEEKQHLAVELHDELGSLHAVLGMELEAVLGELRKRAPDLVERQANALKLLHQARDVKRRIIADLHPTTLDHLGLAATLREHVDRWTRTSEIKAKLQMTDDLPALPKDAALALFRIVQESLTNIAQYAGAKHVDITLAMREQELVLAIADDGVGIAAEKIEHPHSHGILGMRQRIAQCGGELIIANGPEGVGTSVCARLPVHRC